MISMKVHGMHCGGCAGKVKRAINAIDQSAQIQIDLKSGQVKVQSNCSAEEIAKTIKTLGYDVSDVKDKD